LGSAGRDADTAACVVERGVQAASMGRRGGGSRAPRCRHGRCVVERGVASGRRPRWDGVAAGSRARARTDGLRDLEALRSAELRRPSWLRVLGLLPSRPGPRSIHTRDRRARPRRKIPWPEIGAKDVEALAWGESTHAPVGRVQAGESRTQRSAPSSDRRPAPSSNGPGEVKEVP